MGLHPPWQLVRADLEQAAAGLPASAANDRAVIRFRRHLDRDELGLACDELGYYGEDHEVGIEFWRALADAAAKMNYLHLADYFYSKADQQSGISD